MLDGENIENPRYCFDGIPVLDNCTALSAFDTRFYRRLLFLRSRYRGDESLAEFTGFGTGKKLNKHKR